MKRIIVICILLSTILSSIAQEKEVIVPYTLADRDRAIRTEVKLENYEVRFNEIDKKFDEVNARFDRMEDKFNQLFMWGFGMVLMAIFGLIGFIIYDRRTTLAPVQRQSDKILATLQDLAKEDKAIREALKKTALW